MATYSGANSVDGTCATRTVSVVGVAAEMTGAVVAAGWAAAAGAVAAGLADAALVAAGAVVAAGLAGAAGPPPLPQAARSSAARTTHLMALPLGLAVERPPVARARPPR